MELAQWRGYTVEEEKISVHEAMEADEMFTTGTAVVLCAVGSLTYQVTFNLHSYSVVIFLKWIDNQHEHKPLI